MPNTIARYLKPVLKRAELKQRVGSSRAALARGDQKMFLSQKAALETEMEKTLELPAELTGKEYVTFLLHIDAEIEHGLMLQYLYAAYSIGGPQVPEKHRDKVRAWQEILLGVAKEEMGHFISVQNVLRLMGAPLNFARQDYPWDTPFYPFPFKLEPFTLEAMAKYVYAESPEDWIESDDPIAIEIKEKVHSEASDPHRVGALFEVLLQLIKDPHVVPDEVFQSATYPFQAKFDEWGRGYKGGDRGNAMGANPQGSPDVLVAPLSSRDDAYAALIAIAEQGEATTEHSANPSHFERFLTIYKELKEMLQEMGEGWQPSRNVAVNPYIYYDYENDDTASGVSYSSGEERDRITHPEAILWGHLFNLRYRLLLNYLTHSFLLEDGLNSAGARTPRGTIINATFGEMYNLRSIAYVMVQTPLDMEGTKMSGPPFLIPYTLELPMGEHNRWRQYKEVLGACDKIRIQLMEITKESNRKFLCALHEADLQLMAIIDQLTASPII